MNATLPPFEGEEQVLREVARHALLYRMAQRSEAFGVVRHAWEREQRRRTR